MWEHAPPRTTRGRKNKPDRKPQGRPIGPKRLEPGAARATPVPSWDYAAESWFFKVFGVVEGRERLALPLGRDDSEENARRSARSVQAGCYVEGCGANWVGAWTAIAFLHCRVRRGERSSAALIGDENTPLVTAMAWARMLVWLGDSAGRQVDTSCQPALVRSIA